MEQELKNLGLSDNEVKVYLATLKSGSTSVSRIAGITGLPRTTIYDNFKSLIQKGIVSTYKKDKKFHFEAIPPKIFVDQLREKEKIMKQLMPQLSKIAKTHVNKPVATIYEGKKGILSLLEEIYSEKELLVFGSAEKSKEIFSHLPENFARRRADLGIKMKAILERSEEAIFRITDSKISKYTEVRFLKDIKFLPSVTFIFGNKVAVITLKNELIGLKIEDKNVNQTQKILFEMMWKNAKA